MMRERKTAPSPIPNRGDVEWIKSDYFCQMCGVRDCWQECGSGEDYYHDNDVKCFTCGHVMCCVETVCDVSD